MNSSDLLRPVLVPGAHCPVCEGKERWHKTYGTPCSLKDCQSEHTVCLLCKGIGYIR